jgi:hypothetical protein
MFNTKKMSVDIVNGLKLYDKRKKFIIYILTMKGKCKYCGEMKDEGRWVVMRETSKNSKYPRTTFVSNIQISSVSARNQKKIFECAKCAEERASTLNKNLNTLSKKPLDTSIFSIVEEVKEIKKTKKRITDLEKSQLAVDERLVKVEKKVFSSKQTTINIYDFNTIYHWIGWPVFLTIIGIFGIYVYKNKKKKKKITNNY